MAKHLSLTLVYAIAVVASLRGAWAQEPGSQEAEIKQVQSQVRENLEAVYKGDVDTVLKFTHPKVLDLLGGRDRAREVLKGTLTKVLATGIEVEELKFPSPPTFLKGRENEFVIVPTKSIVSVKGKRAESLNYQFGARRVGGGKWLYIEGSRLNRSNVQQWFPDFPRDFKFPATYRKLI